MSNFMKIATLNIDWAKIYNSPNHFLKIDTLNVIYQAITGKIHLIEKNN